MPSMISWNSLPRVPIEPTPIASAPAFGVSPKIGMKARARITSGIARRTLNTWRVTQAIGRPTRFSAARNESGAAKIVASTVPNQAIEIDSHISPIQTEVSDQSMLVIIARKTVNRSAGASSSRFHLASSCHVAQATRARVTTVPMVRNRSTGLGGSVGAATGAGASAIRRAAAAG